MRYDSYSITKNGDADYTEEEINYLYLTSMMDLMSNYSISDSEKFFPFSSDFEVEFYLFTSDPHTYEELITGNISSVTNSSFDFAKETKILVHGWLSSAFSDFSYEMLSAILQNKNCNVIIVEWPSVALYTVARKRVNKVASELSRFLDFLIDEVHVNVSTVHVLGHSLGAHVAGIAGGQMNSTKLPRITGRSPMMDYFMSFNLSINHKQH
ncbi:pancreatic triacylglycerol lipase isoform X1 [Nilaparvata lugens]|uniref:pancreatic triacylglycerol lipase isoform X1 n=1 Tax=Nilaparvata lugens TaxID=108931 RepID=UPI00193D47BD|nr:pancreatic triacylglycerol lipase isoform X1 [Nilaparvata lugens]